MSFLTKPVLDLIGERESIIIVGAYCNTPLLATSFSLHTKRNTIYLSFLLSLVFSIFSFSFLTRYFLCITKRADTRSAPTIASVMTNLFWIYSLYFSSLNTQCYLEFILFYFLIWYSILFLLRYCSFLHIFPESYLGLDTRYSILYL